MFILSSGYYLLMREKAYNFLRCNNEYFVAMSCTAIFICLFLVGRFSCAVFGNKSIFNTSSFLAFQFPAYWFFSSITHGEERPRMQRSSTRAVHKGSHRQRWMQTGRCDTCPLLCNLTPSIF